MNTLHSNKTKSLFFFSSLLSLALLAPSRTARAQDAPAPATEPAAPTAEPAPAPAAEPAAPPAAEPAPPESAAEPGAPETPKPKPPPYSLPFQLRPVAAATVIRSDTALAFYKPDAATSGGSTVATTLLASYKVTPEFAPILRLGLVTNSPPGLPAPATGPGSGTAFMNPVLGGLYGLKFSDFRLGLFLGVTVPVGSGGGDTPDAATRAALQAGILARSAMDNAMFAVNYFTVFPGVGFAFVKSGFTAQVEVTLLQLFRVRGEAVDKDASRTNMTMGLHLGYFFIPELSLGAELRHQRWLSTPTPTVSNNENLRDTSTFAVGPRLHFKLSETAWFRPAIVYARGIDKPMTDGNYNIVQLDLPFSF